MQIKNTKLSVDVFMIETCYVLEKICGHTNMNK